MTPSRLNRLSSSQDDEWKRRQTALTKIVETAQIDKQETIVMGLKKLGFEQSSQATVSRDLQVLGIIKDPVSGFYTLSEQTRLLKQRELLERAILENVEGIFSEVGVFAIRASPGHARSTAVIVEKSFPSEVIGTIASEDSALIIAIDGDSATKIAREMGEVLSRRQV